MTYPERLSRLRLFVKWLLVIPLYIALIFYGIAAGIVSFIAFWAILFTVHWRFPEGMFDFIRGYLAFSYKTMAYFPLLLTDHWSPDDYHPLDFQADHPERLSRLLLVFIKLPSYLLGVGSSLSGISVYVVLLVSIPIWFIILVSGRYPRPLFRFSVSLLQWSAGVGAWQGLMRDDLSLFGTTWAVQLPVVLGAAALLYVGIGLSPWLPVSLPGTSAIERALEEAASVEQVGTSVPIVGDTHIPHGQTFNAYNSIPPTSGPHWPSPIRCGIYDSEVPDELLVHNLEHGNVVISYNLPDLQQTQRLKEVVARLAGLDRWGIVRPYSKIPPGTVAMTAWGVVDTFQGVNEEWIRRFFDTYAANRLSRETASVGPISCSTAPRLDD